MVTESYGGAILFFGKALKYCDNSALQFDIFLNRGKAYYALNRYLDAYNDYQAAYAIDQHSIDVLMALAETNLKLNKINDAMVTINQIIASNPDHAEAYDLLGQIAIKTNNMSERSKRYEKYTSLNRVNPLPSMLWQLRTHRQQYYDKQ
jgi:predicted Zn-dependent protease